MTRTTTLSNLSLAAIALLAASAPCFAQAQSAEIREEASTVVAMATSQPAVPSSRSQLTATEPRFGMLNFEPKSAELSEKSDSLSPDAFRMAMSQFSAVENQNFFDQRATIFETGLGNSKKQFRADDHSSGVDQKKRITFVPSLGQKLPS